MSPGWMIWLIWSPCWCKCGTMSSLLLDSNEEEDDESTFQQVRVNDLVHGCTTHC